MSDQAPKHDSPIGFGTYVWQVFTFRLMYKDSPATFWRVVIYLGMILSSSSAMNLAQNRDWAPTQLDCVAALITSIIHWSVIAITYDLMMRRQNRLIALRETTFKECQAEVNRSAAELERLITQARADAEQWRLGAIEAVSAHALATKRKLDEYNRGIDGEGWKDKQGPSPEGSDT